MKKIISLFVFACVVLYSAGFCFAQSNGPVRLAYVKWSTEIASTTLVKAVFQEKLNKECITVPMKADEMWEAVANGEVDGMVAAWLPGTHGHYYKKYKDKVEDLGPHIDKTRIGLVVPKISVGRQTTGSGMIVEPYIKAESISDLKKYRKEFGGKIVGIDAEAGVMKKTRDAMKAYNLTGYRLIEGSESEMTDILAKAIKKQKWVVVTGWEPHWKFGRWKLEFLDDPKNIYGGSEAIHTVVRKGLKKDMPEVYKVLDNFKWTVDEMEQLLVWISSDKGQFPYEKALRWMNYNEDRVESWIR